MENKTALEELRERMKIGGFLRGEKKKSMLSILDKAIQKDKEQRKALVIESYKDGWRYGYKLGSGQAMKIDEIKMTAEQYYKQKHVSNE
jgi:hypothetical protein